MYTYVALTAYVLAGLNRPACCWECRVRESISILFADGRIARWKIKGKAGVHHRWLIGNFGVQPRAGALDKKAQRNRPGPESRRSGGASKNRQAHRRAPAAARSSSRPTSPNSRTRAGMLDTAVSKFGRLDILHNNAGIGVGAPGLSRRAARAMDLGIESICRQ